MMGRGSKKCLFLVEGQTEQKLVNTLYLGQVRIADLWSLKNSKISSINRLITPNTHVYVVCDTDATDDGRCQNFIKNFYAIERHVGKANITLLQQTSNLESELLYCMSIKRKDLYGQFNNASGNSQFKRNFISERKLLDKLTSNNFDVDKLWEKPVCSCLNSLSLYRLTAKDIRHLLRKVP